MKHLYECYMTNENKIVANLKAGVFSLVMGLFASANAYNATFPSSANPKGDIETVLKDMNKNGINLGNILDYLCNLAIILQREYGLYFVWDELVEKYRRDVLGNSDITTDELIALLVAEEINSIADGNENKVIELLKSYSVTTKASKKDYDRLIDELITPIFDDICIKLRTLGEGAEKDLAKVRKFRIKYGI